MKNDSLLFLWDTLAQIVQKGTSDLRTVIDEPGDLYVENNKGRPFTRVRIQKSHVGVYLLPMYYHPEVLPSSLKQYKTGKSTLRFRHGEDDFHQGVEVLVENCLALVDHY